MKTAILTVLLTLSVLGQWATAQTSPLTRRTVLDTVAATGKIQQLTLLATGGRGNIPKSLPVEPGRRVAVLYRPPTTTHDYDIRSVTLHFNTYLNASREGRVLVQLALPATNGEPSAIYLLAKPLELTAQQIRRAPKQAITLSLQGARLLLPKHGVFVVLTGLPEAAERFVKDTTLVLQKKDLSQVAAIKVTNVHTGHPRVVNLTDYLGLAIVPAALPPVSWEFRRDNKWHREEAVLDCPLCFTFNYWIDLGVTQL